jgi:ABC-type bacteriocin/lantibiotic exporter with double-glycine peptidase domain
MNFPNKYETKVGEQGIIYNIIYLGNQISGGQKQRIRFKILFNIIVLQDHY